MKKKKRFSRVNETASQYEKYKHFPVKLFLYEFFAVKIKYQNASLPGGKGYAVCLQWLAGKYWTRCKIFTFKLTVSTRAESEAAAK